MTTDQPDVALVNMPFGDCDFPSLGVSLLKAILSERGIACDVHYLNLILAADIGADSYRVVAEQLPSTSLSGEWLFAPTLFGENTEADSDYLNQVLWGEFRGDFPPETVYSLMRIRSRLPDYLHRCFRAGRLVTL